MRSETRSFAGNWRKISCRGRFIGSFVLVKFFCSGHRCIYWVNCVVPEHSGNPEWDIIMLAEIGNKSVTKSSVFKIQGITYQ